MLLTTACHTTSQRWRHANHGRLMVPRCFDRARDTAESGMRWAADNDCFQGFNPDAWQKMIGALAGLPGCLFAVAPDVVGDHWATISLWLKWSQGIHDAELPAAFALQNGATIDTIPWDYCDAVFIGGCTGWKLGEDAARIVKSAQARGKWVHMGRVNSFRRIRYAQSIGVDSIDGTKFSRFRDTYMPGGLAAVSSGQQLRLETL